MMDNNSTKPHADTTSDKRGKNKRRKKRKMEKLEPGKDNSVVS